MRQRNIEVVEKLLPKRIDVAEAMRSDDPVAALVGEIDAVDPEIEVRFAAPPTGGPGLERRGLDGLVEAWRDWLTPWETYVMEIEESVDAGDQVVMLVSVRGRTSRGGVEVEHRPAAVWTLEDGKVTAITFFLEREQAFEFAGID